MAAVKSLEMRKRLCCGSMESELHILRKVVQKLLNMIIIVKIIII